MYLIFTLLFRTIIVTPHCTVACLWIALILYNLKCLYPIMLQCMETEIQDWYQMTNLESLHHIRTCMCHLIMDTLQHFWLLQHEIRHPHSVSNVSTTSQCHKVTFSTKDSLTGFESFNKTSFCIAYKSIQYVHETKRLSNLNALTQNTSCGERSPCKHRPKRHCCWIPAGNERQDNN